MLAQNSLQQTKFAQDLLYKKHSRAEPVRSKVYRCEGGLLLLVPILAHSHTRDGNNDRVGVLVQYL